ncbi:MAG: hypothetical protein QOH37_3098 [Nocardioidaceae bacterium]|jgi:hypothetical protein|nr:hypothetical protein [Nocardioidaceae bacterium]
MSSDPIQDILGNLDVAKLAQQVGADPAEVQQAAAAVLPALFGGVHANAQDPAGEASLAQALTQHQNGLASGTIDTTEVDPADGRKVAAHIFGAQQDQVVHQLGATGVSSGLVGKLMPLLAPIVMSYLAKRVTGSTGGALGGAVGGGVLGGVLSQVLQGAAQGAGGASTGSNPMGGILGDVLGGLLGHGTRA